MSPKRLLPLIVAVLLLACGGAPDHSPDSQFEALATDAPAELRSDPPRADQARSILPPGRGAAAARLPVVAILGQSNTSGHGYTPELAEEERAQDQRWIEWEA